MSVRTVQIIDSDLKSLYAEEILRSLPEWFGNEIALRGYIAAVSGLPFWAALNQDENCVGFVAVKIHHGHTGEIYVMGVLPQYHKNGIGKQLMVLTYEYFIKNGCKYVIVKTLSDLAKYEPYEQTRKFYLNVGFEPLITLTEMWDEGNPCLIMMKTLPGG
jgi:ribosomal protein S18 acetylase RimI-like enzyme